MDMDCGSSHGKGPVVGRWMRLSPLILGQQPLDFFLGLPQHILLRLTQCLFLLIHFLHVLWCFADQRADEVVNCRDTDIEWRARARAGLQRSKRHGDLLFGKRAAAEFFSFGLGGFTLAIAADGCYMELARVTGGEGFG